ncbi:MAG: sigma-70 family RNA polymerase sigma factor, partial [Myxococcales bacterium]|nr:sigma-70 family RNA polymerase sigma factor [Myxococcales bacterium]
VIRFFRNKLSDPQDLVQETFLRLAAGRERIADGQALRAYVLGIARHLWYEYARQLARPRPLDVDVDTVENLLPGPSTMAARQHEHRLLLECLRRIPIEHQVILELHYWERLKTDELALLLEVSPSTMRSRLARARTLLARALLAGADSPQRLASTQTNLDEWAEQIRREYLPDADDE